MKKWEHKARIGVCLGQSPRHSKKVALVLNLQTRHVSPQFHCQCDDMCDTLRPSLQNPGVASKWQAKTGFYNHKGKAGKEVADDVFTDALHVPDFELPDNAADLRLPIDTEICLLYHQQLVNKGAIVSNFVWFDLKFPTTMFHQSN